MKADQIYVGVNGATLQLSGGKAIAVYPPQKGENASFMLMESGKMVKVAGARINGVGVPRFLKEQGFALAKPGDPVAATLADRLDVREGLDLVEKASQTEAEKLQQKFAGQTCTFVPFDEDRPIEQVVVEHPQGSTTTSFDLQTGFATGVVKIDFKPGSGLFGVPLASGWLCGPDGHPSRMPRNTDYGGVVERAVYVICNTGLASLAGAQNLVMDEEAAADAPYPRGLMEMELPQGDRVQVGITGGDELEVSYLRDGAVLYSRSGMDNPRLGDVIGAIAAVMVRAKELDAALEATASIAEEAKARGARKPRM